MNNYDRLREICILHAIILIFLILIINFFYFLRHRPRKPYVFLFSFSYCFLIGYSTFELLNRLRTPFSYWFTPFFSVVFLTGFIASFFSLVDVLRKPNGTRSSNDV